MRNIGKTTTVKDKTTLVQHRQNNTSSTCIDKTTHAKHRQNNNSERQNNTSAT